MSTVRLALCLLPDCDHNFPDDIRDEAYESIDSVLRPLQAGYVRVTTVKTTDSACQKSWLKRLASSQSRP